MNFVSFNKTGKSYVANSERVEVEKLPSGFYNLDYDPKSDTVIFNKAKFNHDSLLDLPSAEFDHVLKELTQFLEPKTKKLFEEYGFLYKRSTLLHGIPGTGKTCLVNRIAKEVINNSGVVIFNPHPGVLNKAFEILDDIQPEVKTMVVFEELDTLAKNYESDLLHLLDGEIQKDNVMYMATTNFFDSVPRRLCRPGRFSSIVEVKFPNSEAREFYLENKLPEKDFGEIPEWVKKTEGLSIDELKETVLAVKCLGQDLDTVIERLKATEDRKHTKDEDFYNKLETVDHKLRMREMIYSDPHGEF